MNIQLQYKASPETLARASMIFLEQKWLMWIAIQGFNILAVFLMIVLPTAWFVFRDINIQEIITLLLSGFWLFGRRPMTERFLAKRMHKDIAHTKGTQISLSKNGIAWGGPGVKQDSLAWPHVRFIIRVRNGYIVPARITRFIWLPDEAFEDKAKRKVFEKHAKEMNVRFKRIKKSC